MKILILETTTEKCLLALAQDGRILTTHHLPGGPSLSKTIAKLLDELLKSHNFTPDLIAASEGPGSYTGIRVGAALAEGLALGFNIPILGFSSLKSFLPPIPGPFASLIDARSGGVYVLKGERKEDGQCFFETPARIPAADLPAYLAGISHFASPSSDALQKKLNLDGLWFETAPQTEFLLRVIETSYAEGNRSLTLNYLSTPA